MKYIISGTDRPGSNTLKISKYIQGIYTSLGEEVEIIDLLEVKKHLHDDLHYGTPSAAFQTYLEKIKGSDGLIVITPEYNGSMPGILKYFIDHLKYPESFEYRPICFIGLGGRFGGLRPVEHLQQVFGYRNSFIFPERVFLTNVGSIMDAEGRPSDELIKSLLVKQAKGFQKFSAALRAFELDANSVIAKQPQPTR